MPFDRVARERDGLRDRGGLEGAERTAAMMMPWGMFGGFGPGGGFGLAGLLMMLVFWGLLIAGIVLVVRWLLEPGRPGGARALAEDSALEILKKRYARGEIGKEEFEAKKRDLV